MHCRHRQRITRYVDFALCGRSARTQQHMARFVKAMIPDFSVFRGKYVANSAWRAISALTRLNAWSHLFSIYVKLNSFKRLESFVQYTCKWLIGFAFQDSSMHVLQKTKKLLQVVMQRKKYSSRKIAPRQRILSGVYLK